MSTLVIEKKNLNFVLQQTTNQEKIFSLCISRKALFTNNYFFFSINSLVH